MFAARLCAILLTATPASAASTYTLTWTAGTVPTGDTSIYLSLPVVHQTGYTSQTSCDAAVSDTGGVYDTAKHQLTGLEAIYGNPGKGYQIVLAHICTRDAPPATAPALLIETAGWTSMFP
jgi:hypothetical protein